MISIDTSGIRDIATLRALRGAASGISELRSAALDVATAQRLTSEARALALAAGGGKLLSGRNPPGAWSLQVVAVPQALRVEWTLPADPDGLLWYWQVWRQETAVGGAVNISEAVLHAVVAAGATQYLDLDVDQDHAYHYWLRSMSPYLIYSAWLGPAHAGGDLLQVTVDRYRNLLAGQLGEGQVVLRDAMWMSDPEAPSGQSPAFRLSGVTADGAPVLAGQTSDTGQDIAFRASSFRLMSASGAQSWPGFLQVEDGRVTWSGNLLGPALRSRHFAAESFTGLEIKAGTVRTDHLEGHASKWAANYAATGWVMGENTSSYTSIADGGQLQLAYHPLIEFPEQYPLGRVQDQKFLVFGRFDGLTIQNMYPMSTYQARGISVFGYMFIALVSNDTEISDNNKILGQALVAIGSVSAVAAARGAAATGFDDLVPRTVVTAILLPQASMESAVRYGARVQVIPSVRMIDGAAPITGGLLNPEFTVVAVQR